MLDTGLMAVVRLIAAIFDYIFKAILSYKDTEQGAAEWLDIVAAYEQVTGDTEGAQAARAEANVSRSNSPVKAQAVSVRPSPSKINLNDQ